MDYIYGKLNKEVEKVAYKGGTTSSAQVSVDNSTNTIYVETQSGVVDSFLNKESTNPVQNKVVTQKLTEVANDFERLNEQVVSRLSSYSDEIDSIAETVSSLSKDFQELNEETSAKVSDITEQIVANNEAIKELQNSSVTRDIESRVEQNALNIGILNDATAKAVKALQDTDNEFNSTITELSESIDAEHIGRVHAIRQLENSMSEIYKEISDLSEVITNNDLATRSEVALLSQDLTKKIQAVQENISKLSNECDQSDTELQNQIEDLKAKDLELSASIEDIKLYVNQTISDSTKQDIEEINARISDLTAQLNTLQTSYSSSVKDIFSIMQTLKTHESMIEDVQKSVSDVRNELIVSVGQLSTRLAENCNAIDGDINNLSAMIGTVDLTKTGSLADQISELHGHLVVAISQLNDIEADITDEVADAIDKINATGLYVITRIPTQQNVTYVYASNATGNITINASKDAIEGNVTLRGKDGNIALPEDAEFEDTDAVHKKYVDNQIYAKTSDLEDAIMSIMNERFSIIDGGTSADLIKN